MPAVYHALLTRRYLTTKLIPSLSVLAVMLCSAMVLIVWSIMGGFLEKLLGSGEDLMGDVAITWPIKGFAHYEDLIGRLEAHDEIAAAAPEIQVFGLLELPDGRLPGVYIRGIDPQRHARVVGYFDSLYWKPMDTPLPRDGSGLDPRLSRANDDPDAPVNRDARFIDPAFWERVYEDGRTLSELKDSATGERTPAIVLGIELADYSQRTAAGYYETIVTRFGMGFAERLSDGSTRPAGSVFMPDNSVRLTLLPVSDDAVPFDVVQRAFPVANEFQTKVHDVNSGQVLLPLDELQRLLRMDEAERIDEETFDPVGGFGEQDGSETFGDPDIIGIEPARVTTVLVRGAEGVTSERVQEICKQVYAEFHEAHLFDTPPTRAMERNIVTWKQRNGAFVAAVQKEIGLVLFLLLFISMTAVFLILAIFWAMVSEKTRDIGILRAIGATGFGVAWIWLRYGLAIGVVGAVLGMIVAHVIVWNINPIHEWLGRALGLTIWDPSIYVLVEIPNDVNPTHALVVFVGAIIASAVGALVPAIKAARLDPVTALRFE